jgi:hypothetical protein
MYKVIGRIDHERMLFEIESLNVKSQMLLQGISTSQDPFELVSRIDDGNVNAWERKQEKEFTVNEVIHPLFHIPYTNSVCEEYQLGYTRCMVLNSKRCYTYHIDRSRRIHIPLITNDSNFFVIDDKVYKLPADGSVYEVDTTRIHTFVNASLENRLHIVGCQRTIM